MKHLTITLAFLMTLSTQANSGIVANRDSWNKMDLVLRFGYVLGVWDTITLNLVGEPERARSYKDKLHACGNEMELALSFVDIVNEGRVRGVITSVCESIRLGALGLSGAGNYSSRQLMRLMISLLVSNAKPSEYVAKVMPPVTVCPMILCIWLSGLSAFSSCVVMLCLQE